MITQEQIFKAAGVKNKKELYKKFSTEEAFMAKCGGKIRKAQMGAVMHGGQKSFNPQMINFRDIQEKSNKSILGYTDAERQDLAYKQQMLAAQQAQAKSGGKSAGIMGQLLQGIGGGDGGGNGIGPVISGPLEELGIEIEKKYGGKIPKAPNGWYGSNTWNGETVPLRPMATNINAGMAQQGLQPGTGPNGGPMGIDTGGQNGGQSFNDIAEKWAGPVGKVIGGFKKLKAEKEARRSAKQWHGVTDISKIAAASRPEEMERRYARPEDIQNTGVEFFPIYGVGTNVLAKDGKKISKAQGGGNFPWGQVGQLGGGIAGAAMGNNAGGDIGGEIGGGIGSIFGPVGGAIGRTAGTIFGSLLDKNPKITRRHQRARGRNMASISGGYLAQGVQQMNDAHMQDGGDVAMNGDLQVYNGDVETISTNRYLPGGGQTVQFNGPSHKDGGQRISFGNSPVEVEGGETGVKLEDGGQVGDESLTIFGNLKIPKNMLEDPLAKNKKFKNYDKILSKKEESLNKLATKNTIKLGEANSFTRFGKIKEDTLKLIDEGINMKLKDLAQRKMDAAALQNAINDTAKEQGIVADDLAKGKYKVDKKAIKEYAKWGASLKKLEDGDPVKKEEEYEKVVRGDAEKLVESGDWKYTDDKKDTIVRVVKEGEEKEVIKKVDAKPGKYKEEIIKTKAPGKGSKEFNAAFAKARKEGLKTFMFKGKEKTTDLYDEKVGGIKKSVEVLPSTPAREEKSIVKTDPIYEYKNVFDPEKKSTTVEEEEKPKIPWWALANQGLEYLRPSDAEGLDPNQLAGELYSMANNQEEGVPAQGYRPQLDVPYDISLQDQLNEITASERATQKLAGYNPAFSAMVASQAYGPKSKVLADQFRLNQAMKDKVFSANRALMNDAQLKNLAIFDQQYTRQAQAKSNTKEAIQLALNSVAGKYSQNKLENRTLGVYENMYKYRFDKDGRAINMNPFYEFNYDGNQGLASTDVQKMRAEAREKVLRDVIRAQEREKAKYEYQGTGDIPPNANQSYNSKYGRMGKNGISIPKALKDY